MVEQLKASTLLIYVMLAIPLNWLGSIRNKALTNSYFLISQQLTNAVKQWQNW